MQLTNFHSSIFNFSYQNLKWITILSLILYALLGLNKIVQAKEKHWITELDTTYQQFHNQLDADPYSIVKALELILSEGSLTPLLKEQTYLLLSLSYANLELPDQAADYANKGLKTVSEQDQPWLFHQLSIARAYAYDRQGTPEKGFEKLNQALIWARGFHDEAMIVRALHVRAGLNISLVEYIKALEDLQQALALAPETSSQNSLRLTITKGGLQESFALLYEYRRENELSIPYFEAAINYHREQNNWMMLTSSLYGLGHAFSALQNLERAHGLLMESKQIAEQINDRQGVAYALKELSKIEEKWNNYDNAEDLALDALAIFKEANNIYMYIDVSISLFRLALRINKDIDKSEQYLNFARAHINKSSMPYQSIGIDENQTELYAAKNEYKKAYLLSLKIMQEKQILLREQSSRELHNIRARYELEAIEQKNQLLQQENSLNKINIETIQQKNQVLLLLVFFSLIVVSLILILYFRIKNHKKTLEMLANTDSLTGLLNRRKSMQLMIQQLSLAKRHQQHFCLVLLDLDWFKKINDNYGHTIGDKVLIEFSRLCKQQLRNTDIIARYGGEEFLLALPHTELSDAQKLIEKLRLQIKTLSKNSCFDDFNSKKMKLSFSAGITNAEERDTISDLISQADSALYKAKNAGRDRIVIYTK